MVVTKFFQLKSNYLVTESPVMCLHQSFLRNIKLKQQYTYQQ